MSYAVMQDRRQKVSEIPNIQYNITPCDLGLLLFLCLPCSFQSCLLCRLIYKNAFFSLVIFILFLNTLFQPINEHILKAIVAYTVISDYLKIGK